MDLTLHEAQSSTMSNQGQRFASSPCARTLNAIPFDTLLAAPPYERLENVGDLDTDPFNRFPAGSVWIVKAASLAGSADELVAWIPPLRAACPAIPVALLLDVAADPIVRRLGFV